MKVILLQDVAKIGRRFDIVEVPSGYGMNKLIPQAMAKPATPENVKAIQAQATKNEAHKAAGDEAFTQMLEALKAVTLEISAEANEEGRLFQALKADTVAEAVKAATEKEVALNQIVIKTPIKEVGDHSVEFVSGDIVVPITVSVLAK
jgi:large subunit ribosomal protein L9